MIISSENITLDANISGRIMWNDISSNLPVGGGVVVIALDRKFEVNELYFDDMAGYAKYYNKYAERYTALSDEGKLFFHEKIQIPALEREIQGLRFERALDIGSGIGIYSEIISKYSDVVIGVDLSKEMHRIALDRQKSKNICHLNQDILNFCDAERFDFIFAGFMLSYFDDLEKFFSRVSKLMRPGALFVASMLHPIRMSSDRRGRSGYQVRKYLTSGHYASDFLSVEDALLLNRHTFSSVVNSSIATGLRISKMSEPAIVLSAGEIAEIGDCFYTDNPSIMMISMTK